LLRGHAVSMMVSMNPGFPRVIGMVDCRVCRIPSRALRMVVMQSALSLTLCVALLILASGTIAAFLHRLPLRAHCLPASLRKRWRSEKHRQDNKQNFHFAPHIAIIA